MKNKRINKKEFTPEMLEYLNYVKKDNIDKLNEIDPNYVIEETIYTPFKRKIDTKKKTYKKFSICYSSFRKVKIETAKSYLASLIKVLLEYRLKLKIIDSNLKEYFIETPDSNDLTYIMYENFDPMIIQANCSNNGFWCYLPLKYREVANSIYRVISCGLYAIQDKLGYIERINELC